MSGGFLSVCGAATLARTKRRCPPALHTHKKASRATSALRWDASGASLPALPARLEPPAAPDLAIDAALGLLAFWALGGRLLAVLPSDLRYPGARAAASIPTGRVSRDYADPAARGELRAIFTRFGCHSCGRRTGPSVADHQPPNKIVYGGAAEAGSREEAWWRRNAAGPQGWLSWLGRGPRMAGKAKLKQRFYPQCVPCSLKQADAMRRSARRLVMHRARRWLEPHDLAGALVGLRHYSSQQPAQRPAAGSSGRGRRASW